MIPSSLRNFRIFWEKKKILEILGNFIFEKIRENFSLKNMIWGNFWKKSGRSWEIRILNPDFFLFYPFSLSISIFYHDGQTEKKNKNRKFSVFPNLLVPPKNWTIQLNESVIWTDFVCSLLTIVAERLATYLNYCFFVLRFSILLFSSLFYLGKNEN